MISLSYSKAILEELRALVKKATSSGHVQRYRIALALLWFGEGQSLSEIGKALSINTKTVFNWLKRFMHGGMEWLKGQHYTGRGRRSKLSEEEKVRLYEMVVAGPEANGFRSGIWNTAMIGEMIVREFGESYNLNYLSSLLGSLGLSYQKAKFISDKVDEAAHEENRQDWLKRRWPAIVAQAEADDAVILFGDEVSFAMWGSLAYTWAPKGQQPEVKTRGVRQGLKMFGAIEVKGGNFHYLECLAYTLKAKSLKLLKEAGLPTTLLQALKTLKNEHYPTQEAFLDALKQVVETDLLAQYQDLIVQHAAIAGKFNGDSYKAFLQHLLSCYQGNIILIEDGASYHKRADVVEFWNNEARLSVYSLPTFSPEYNPIEKLWKNTKRDATHLKYFASFANLRHAVLDVFKGYMEDASKVLCVMKQLREDTGFSA